MIAVDAAGRIALLNARAEKMFGYSRAELIGKPVEVLIPERFRGGHAGLRKEPLPIHGSVRWEQIGLFLGCAKTEASSPSR